MTLPQPDDGDVIKNIHFHQPGNLSFIPCLILHFFNSFKLKFENLYPSLDNLSLD